MTNADIGRFQTRREVYVDYDLGFANLTSITAYRESSQAVNGDVDFSSLPLLTNGIYDDFETFTQEFRLTSNSDGPLQWMIGAWYQDESVEHDSLLQVVQHQEIS